MRRMTRLKELFHEGAPLFAARAPAVYPGRVGRGTSAVGGIRSRSKSGWEKRVGPLGRLSQACCRRKERDPLTVAIASLSRLLYRKGLHSISSSGGSRDPEEVSNGHLWTFLVDFSGFHFSSMVWCLFVFGVHSFSSNNG